VGKLPRLAGDGGALASEARNLRAVERALPGGDTGTVPSVVAFDGDPAYPLLLEKALVGRALSPAAVRGDRDRIVGAVEAWLRRLGAATAARPRDEDWYERLVSEPLRELARAPGQTAAVQEMVARTLGAAEVLRAWDLPLVFEHGDFCHPNLVLLADGRVGVLDWERADPAGLPAYDLLCFLAYAAWTRRRVRDREAGMRAAFFGRRSWAWRAAERYTDSLGIDRVLLAPLLAVSCARALARSAPAARLVPLWRDALREVAPAPGSAARGSR
jgi:hypothetical protein